MGGETTALSDIGLETWGTAYEDGMEAQTVVGWGANLYECQDIYFQEHIVPNGAPLVAVDPRRTFTAAYAEDTVDGVHLQLVPGHRRRAGRGHRPPHPRSRLGGPGLHQRQHRHGRRHRPGGCLAAQEVGGDLRRLQGLHRGHGRLHAGERRPHHRRPGREDRARHRADRQAERRRHAAQDAHHLREGRHLEHQLRDDRLPRQPGAADRLGRPAGTRHHPRRWASGGVRRRRRLPARSGHRHLRGEHDPQLHRPAHGRWRGQDLPRHRRQPAGDDQLGAVVAGDDPRPSRR